VLPFPGRSPRELFQQLLTQSPIPLSEAIKGLKFSPTIEQAVMTPERDLSKRWKSVGFCPHLLRCRDRRIAVCQAIQLFLDFPAGS
jgi:hypothetical protein